MPPLERPADPWPALRPERGPGTSKRAAQPRPRPASGGGRAALLLLLAGAVGGCAAGPGGAAGARRSDPPSAGAPLGDDRLVRVGELGAADHAEFRRAWAQFVGDHPLWPVTVRAWVDRGGAAPYVLAENLFRYFWSASGARHRGALARVREVAGWIGEPAVAYFAKPLVTDEVPLPRPVTVQVPDPDDPRATKPKTFDRFKMDDVTRQDAAAVLAAIGAPAVPTLASPAVLRDARPTARRYALYALGRIGTPEALAALGAAARDQADWRDRAAAVQALGLSVGRDDAVRPALEAAREDPDPFVRRKADEALAGQSRVPLER